MKNTMETPSEWQQSFQQTFYHRREWQIHAKGSKGRKEKKGPTRNTEPGEFIIENWREKTVFQTSTK